MESSESGSFSKLIKDNWVFVACLIGVLIMGNEIAGMKAQMDTPLLMNTLMTFCGSKERIESVCLDGNLPNENYALPSLKRDRIKMERFTGCAALMEETRRRNFTVSVGYGNKTYQMPSSEMTLEKLYEMEEQKYNITVIK